MLSNKADKIAGFFQEALNMGYSFDDAWQLLLNSKQGQGILNGEYIYLIHHQGRYSALLADKDLGNNFVNRQEMNVKYMTIELLAEFIELAHNRFGMEYKGIFSKCQIGAFMSLCGNILGNYDDKLIKRYLL